MVVVQINAGQPGARLRPLAGCLKRDDFGKIDRMQQDLGRGQAAEAAARQLVEPRIVDGGAFKAHSADQSNGLHFYSADFCAVMMDTVAWKKRSMFA